MQKIIAVILLSLTFVFGNGCRTAARLVSGRGNVSTDEFVLAEKYGNDGHVIATYKGQKIGEFDTPYRLTFPRSNTGDYMFNVRRNGFQELNLKLTMGAQAGDIGGTAANVVMLPLPPLMVLGVLTDTVFTDSTKSMGGKDVETDGDKILYTLAPIGGTKPVQNEKPTVQNIPFKPEVVHHYHTNLLVQVPEPEVRTVFVTNQVPVYVDRLVPTTNTVIIVPPTVSPAGGSSGGTATSGEIFVNPRRN